MLDALTWKCVLKNLDTATQLSCIFLNKQLHEVVMYIFREEFTILRDIRSQYADMYYGIMITYTNDRPEYTHNNLLDIYATLYTINTGISWHSLDDNNNIYDHHLVRIVKDVAFLSEKYSRKLPANLFATVFDIVFNRYRFTRTVHDCVSNVALCTIQCPLIQTVKLILSRGFDINLQCMGTNNATLLIKALRIGDSAMIEVICSMNPDVYVTDNTGKNAINEVQALRERIQRGFDWTATYLYMIHTAMSKVEALIDKHID
jgi:hypothetical protein